MRGTLFKPGTVLRVYQSTYFINTDECGEGTYEAFFASAYSEVVVVGWAVGKYWGTLPGRLQVFVLHDHLCARKKSTGEVGTGWPVLVMRKA